VNQTLPARPQEPLAPWLRLPLGHPGKTAAARSVPRRCRPARMKAERDFMSLTMMGGIADEFPRP